MYMILVWRNNDNFLTCIHNENGSIKLFNTLQEADDFPYAREDSGNLRVISTDSVRRDAT